MGWEKGKSVDLIKREIKEPVGYAASQTILCLLKQSRLSSHTHAKKGVLGRNFARVNVEPGVKRV